MKTLFAFLMLTSLSAQAEETKYVQFMIGAKMTMDGKVMSNPRVANLAGEPSIIETSDSDGNSLMKFEVKATEVPGSPDLVKLAYKLASNYQGDTVKFEGLVQVKGKDPAIFVVENPSGHTYELHLTAERL